MCDDGRSKIIKISDSDSDMCSKDIDEQNKWITPSCWDELDPKWMEGAKRDTDNSIYVHEEILEWIVEQINENMLDTKLRATVEEVYHHSMSGRVYLITFFQRFSLPEEKYPFLRKMEDLMSYKMPWKVKPTYFLRIDSQFQTAKLMLTKFLDNLNLGSLINTTILEVNWIYIPKIEIYEFQENLSDTTIKAIDDIFGCLNSFRPMSIYICNQFPWHKHFGDYIDIDTLAMDICAEEWKRLDLLKDYSVPDILCLDLANKDYRDPYLNEYLDRYLNILLTESLPQLISNLPESKKYSMVRCSDELGSYFASRFHHKMSMLCCFFQKIDPLIVTKLYNLSTSPQCKDVYLTGDQPQPDTLLFNSCQIVKYNISNYTHMTDSLFRALINRLRIGQTFMFRFDKQFTFDYKSDQLYSFHEPNDFFLIYFAKVTVIELHDCIESNAEHLATFVKYLTRVLNEIKRPNLRIIMCFTNCMIDDYTCLDDIGSGCDTIEFRSMSFSPQQIKILGRALNQIKSIVFWDCRDITDMQVMMLLDNIELGQLCIRGITSCTPALYFLIAEYLMEQDGDTIRAEWIFNIFNFCNVCNARLNKSIFVVDNDQIVTQNQKTKKKLDFCCLWNGINEDDVFDVSNNIYAE